ncbi:copper homeostasis protein CutC [Catenulispora sp. NF23]|uniref:copper homeostasis protein CutC n=1 Tax=Catenulispora pinistramenti TaxID=2705254 RepID=UPI001BA4CAB5|nr:copper homeostasis protein CutC [Catenulispora pinistramenti]MBS2538141.1 copper homeostasis protein CutC [Catenulispora pinistramenti]
MSDPTPLLEVIAVDADDARAAAAGGADRLELVSSMEHSGFDPAVETFEAVRAAVDVPLRVMIRRRAGFSAGGVQGVAELVHAAEALRRAGADEFVLGWLDEDGTVDIEAVRAVLDALGGAKWTFHKAIDAAPDRAVVYDAIRKLPGLDTVLTSGGFPASGDGLEVLRAESERERAAGGPRVLVGGGLTREALPELRAAGLDAFHVGTAVRAAGTWDSPVDVEKVALWRKALV